MVSTSLGLPIQELSELLLVGGCPHGLVNHVDMMIKQAIQSNRGKFPGISSNRTNNIRFYKIRGEVMSSVSPKSQFKKNRPRLIPETQEDPTTSSSSVESEEEGDNSMTRDPLVRELLALDGIMADSTQEEVATAVAVIGWHAGTHDCLQLKKI